jgi:hypothetical protein
MRVAPSILCAALALASCSRPAPETAPQARADASPAPQVEARAPSPAAAIPAAAPEVPAIDACTLLAREEIAAVQGAEVTASTPSSRKQGGLAVAQCYFALPTTTDSLSLIVYKNPAGAVEKTPAVLWNEMFHVERPAKTGRDGKPKVQPNPQKIEGVGDEAFWGGGQFGGTLHVLKGEDVFQLSVGGPGDEAKKLEALKQLASKIAERL